MVGAQKAADKGGVVKSSHDIPGTCMACLGRYGARIEPCGFCADRAALEARAETLADVEARNDPKEDILRSNMRRNDWGRIIVNDNSYRSTRPLDKDDVVLDWKPKRKSKTA